MFSPMNVEFYEDPDAFLERAGRFLAAHIQAYSIIATQARKPRGPEPYWFAVISDEEIRGCAMRTHPSGALFVPTLGDAALSALSAALRGHGVTAANGDLDSCLALVPNPVVKVHTRRFVLDEVIWPTRPHGELRQATHDDLELVRRWREQFHWDSELQGGRTPELVDPYGAGLEDKIPNHWIWEVDGQPVHMSAMQDTGLGLQRIGPVFTPEEHRGRGYAAWVVATLSQRALDAGDTPSLYTDQANPVSNKIYQRIGYYAVADEGEVESMST